MMVSMQQEVIISAQNKWTGADKFTREQMLATIGWFSSDANKTWKKLSHNAKLMLSGKNWTK